MVIILRCERAEKNKKEASQLIGANASMQRPKSVLRMLPWILYHSISQMSNETMWSALKRNNNYVVSHRSNHMVKLCGRSRELASFLTQQVLYCNLEKRICQVILRIICCTLFATRRSDATSLTQYTASVIAVCKAHLK